MSVFWTVSATEPNNLIALQTAINTGLFASKDLALESLRRYEALSPANNWHVYQIRLSD
ncbi:MAG: hypothetical protein AAGF24_11765 [Cyanobacteria bacterium P01_H01_bin.121]